MNKENIGTTCVAIILCLGLLILPGQAQQSSEAGSGGAAATSSAPSTGAPTSSDTAASSQKVVLKVGDRKMTRSEMDDIVSKLNGQARAIVARRGKRPLADEYVRMLLLSQRAVEEHLDSSPEVRLQLEQLRNQTLAEAEYEDMTRKVEVSANEVSQYFASHRPDFEVVKVREFAVRQSAKGSDDPKKGLPPDKAKAKAEAIRKALQAGTDIEKVAATYASFPNVILVDKKMKYLRRDQMSPALSEATFAVQEGVTEPVVTPDTVYVVRVFGHANPELKDLQEEIIGTIRQNKLDAEMEEMKKKAGVWMDEEYFSGSSLPKLTRPALEPQPPPNAQ